MTYKNNWKELQSANNKTCHLISLIFFNTKEETQSWSGLYGLSILNENLSTNYRIASLVPSSFIHYGHLWQKTHIIFFSEPFAVHNLSIYLTKSSQF